MKSRSLKLPGTLRVDVCNISFHDTLPFDSKRPEVQVRSNISTQRIKSEVYIFFL